MAKRKTAAVVIGEYFGLKGTSSEAEEAIAADRKNFSYEKTVGVGGRAGFVAELSRMSPEEKLALARQAAKELGYTEKDVDFPLA